MTRRAALTGGLLTLALASGAMPVEGQSEWSSAPTASGSELTLRPGDILRITVWPNAELGGEYVIEESGYVYLPMLEAVMVAGIPVGRVREELRRSYGQAMRNPVVTVTPVFSVVVTGAVQRPGVYAITPTHSLFDVLAMAGGLQQTADARSVRVVRPGEVIRFDARQALEYGERLEGVQLRSGDHVVVPLGRQPFNWRNVLAMVQTISLLFVTYERIRR
jgi:protein involved in polysaccharide export with SLBB domain